MQTFIVINKGVAQRNLKNKFYFMKCWYNAVYSKLNILKSQQQ